MLVSEAITKINYAFRGSDDDAPSTTDPDYAQWLSVINTKKDEFYNDPNQKWATTYEVRDIGTISASGAPSFDLDDDFLAPAGLPYTLDSDDNRTAEFPLVKPDERDPRVQSTFIASMNPKVLYFSNEILSTDAFVGDTLYLPGYYLPDNLTSATQEIPIPDPNWLVYAVAAELAYNDIIYENKAPDLQAKADDLYRKLMAKNRQGTFNNPRKVPYNMPPIGSRTR